MNLLGNSKFIFNVLNKNNNDYGKKWLKSAKNETIIYERFDKSCNINLKI